MDRRPTTQDITWLLDLDRNNQLDLDPPYQRRSVWTPKDRRFFLDTIFRNYPSPAIFLHKNISDDGRVKYFVVDGKQRLETILNFVRNKLRISGEYGDARLDNKKWKDISGDLDLKHRFWNYQITVEMIDAREGDLVRNVFDRLNRNSRRLTAQELRHAKFEGWFISRAEAEADLEEWAALGVATRARSNRMIDVQFISELMAVLIRERPLGFGQEELDALYAEYEDTQEVADFSEVDFDEKFSKSKETLLALEAIDNTVTKWARGFGHLYTLWCVVALSDSLPEISAVAGRYASFMAKVDELADHPADQSLPVGPEYPLAAKYRENARGASTEETQRIARFDALRSALIQP